MKSIIQILLLTSLISCGADGAMGPQGLQGIPGPLGPPGPSGSTNILAFVSMDQNANTYVRENISGINHPTVGTYQIFFGVPITTYGVMVTSDDAFINCSMTGAYQTHFIVNCANISHVPTDSALEAIVFGY